ncbi:MAG: hypothetical protein M0Z76_10190 [Gammaproteobacteria bacterium]|nr:hypothetical protein [Gammaproteobacteria bacterium]
MQKKKRALAVVGGSAVIGAAILGAIGVASAAPAPRPKPAMMYVRINGERTPVQGFERTVRLPGGGVFREESFTWGEGAQPQAGSMRIQQMTPQQAQAVITRSLAMFHALQVSMDRQMATMQRLMPVSFAPMPAAPIATWQPGIALPLAAFPQPLPAAVAPAPRAPSAYAGRPRYEVIRWAHPARPPAKRPA